MYVYFHALYWERGVGVMYCVSGSEGGERGGSWEAAKVTIVNKVMVVYSVQVSLLVCRYCRPCLRPCLEGGGDAYMCGSEHCE